MFLHVLQIYCEFIVLMIYLLGKLKNKVFVGYAKFWNWNTRQFLYTVSNTCAKYFVVHCKNIKSFFSLSQVTIMHFKLLWFKKNVFHIYTYYQNIKHIMLIFLFTIFSNERAIWRREDKVKKKLEYVILFSCLIVIGTFVL